MHHYALDLWTYSAHSHVHKLIFAKIYWKKSNYCRINQSCLYGNTLCLWIVFIDYTFQIMPEQSHFNIVDNCVAHHKLMEMLTKRMRVHLQIQLSILYPLNSCTIYFIIGVWIQIYLVLKLKLKSDSHCNKINSHNISPFRIASLFTELTTGFIFTVALILFHFNYTHTHRHHSLTYIHTNSQPYTCMQLKHMHTCTLTFMCPLSHTHRAMWVFFPPASASNLTYSRLMESW